MRKFSTILRCPIFEKGQRYPQNRKEMLNISLILYGINCTISVKLHFFSINCKKKKITVKNWLVISFYFVVNKKQNVH